MIKYKLKKVLRVKKNLKTLNQTNLFWLIFLTILAIGVFFRTYNHKNWLLFQLDQSRDAIIVDKAMNEGILKLPLLGPQASGSSGAEKVYLGPIFYYFQYFVVFIFGNHPYILAWPDLIFSISSIILLFYFSKKYFSIQISLALMLVYSFSFFLIFYGRFAWNPNSIPFFMLLMLIGLLNFVEKDKKKWLILASFSVAILMQLHFITFFLAPLVFFFFLCFNYKKINYKKIILIFLIILSLNTPVIIFEYKNNIQNTRNLLNATFNRADISEKADFFKKAFRSFQKVSFYNWIILSSNQNLERIELYQKKNGSFNLKCDKDCRQHFFNSIGAIVFFLIGLFLLFYNYKKAKKSNEKNFLLLNIILILIFLLIVTPIIKEDKPRFFLVSTISYFVFLGFIFDLIKNIFKNKTGSFLIVLFVMFLSVANLVSIRSYFIENKKLSSLKNIEESEKSLITPGGEKTTFLQLKKIARLLELDAQESGFDEIVFTADNYYARSIAHILNQRKIIVIKEYYKLSDFDPPFIHSNAYYINRTNSTSHFKEDVLADYKIISKKEASTLTVYKIKKITKNY